MSRVERAVYETEIDDSCFKNASIAIENTVSFVESATVKRTYALWVGWT
jgi:hypothetical protein